MSSYGTSYNLTLKSKSNFGPKFCLEQPSLIQSYLFSLWIAIYIYQYTSLSSNIHIQKNTYFPWHNCWSTTHFLSCSDRSQLLLCRKMVSAQTEGNRQLADIFGFQNIQTDIMHFVFMDSWKKNYVWIVAEIKMIFFTNRSVLFKHTLCFWT